MTRILILLCQVISLLLLVGTCVLWVRGEEYRDVIAYRKFVLQPTVVLYHEGVISCCEGGAYFSWMTGDRTNNPQALIDVAGIRESHPPIETFETPIEERYKTDRYFVDAKGPHPLGFQYYRLTGTHPEVGSHYTKWQWSIPFWFFAAIFSILPIVGLVRLIRRFIPKRTPPVAGADGLVSSIVAMPGLA